MSDLQHDIADLSPERRKLLALLYRQQAQKHLAEIPRLPRASGSTTFPLSFAQQRLWFIDQFQPGSITYNMLSALRLTGPLQPTALSQALNLLVQRHETLRTTFAEADEQPVQVIALSLTLALPITDLTHIDPTDHEQTIQRWILDEARRPFDLRQGPLVRTRLLHLGDHEHVLILVLHHIIADGWSQSVLVRELTTLYRACLAGQPHPEDTRLPPLPIQYADFAHWQRDRLQETVLATQLAYWKNQLADLPKLLLPTDAPRRAIQSITGARQIHVMSPTLMEALKQLSQQEGTTLFQTLLAAFQVLLYRYSGQDDLAVGSAIAGRNRAEVEPLIGLFVNTLVLRVRLSGNPTFRAALQQVREVTLAAYAHQDLPFEQLVEALQPERDLSATPLFQVLFVLQNTPQPTFNLPPLTIELLATEHVTAAQDLSLSIVETADGLRLRLQYNAELFAATTITRLLDHYELLLHAIVHDPGQRINALPLLTPDEARQILIDWNNTAAEYPQEICLHDLVTAQAQRTPNAIAVIYGDQQITYGELNRRANQLAHYLRNQGVGPEVKVGLCVAPAIEQIVGILGILKAGGAYVPLDPTYPQERLAWMLADSDARVVLTLEHLLERLATSSPPSICLDRDWPQIAQRPDSEPGVASVSSNLAYVIYTSGSTGTPKGTLLTHQGAINNLWWRQHIWPLTVDDRLLQVFSISFDPAVWSIFWPLIAGARLVLVSTEEHGDSAALVRLMVKHQITAYGASPPLHAMIFAEPEIAACTSLRYIVSGGEQLTAELQRRCFTQLSATLCNCYGPTEATIDATFWVCPRDAEPQAAPIGRPLPNVQMYLLDRQLQPVPIGVAGELYIGGDGLARGYHGRPDLTAEHFVPNPFGEAGARMYRTGDLAKYRADATLVFVGRADSQIKLRGFRIELGEIEAALRQHPAVHEAVVLLREDRRDDLRLVAYVVENKEQTNKEQKDDAHDSCSLFSVLCSAELRQHLGARLPDYMLPSAFVLLDALPLTPTGKVDRRALPEPELSDLERTTQLVLPRTPQEAIIADVWSAILGLRPVGVHDNFFAIGGHSLRATQVVARLRQLFEREIPLRLLFEAPTIAQLAPRLMQAQAAAAPPIQPALRDGTPLPLSFAQQRLWFLDQVQPGSTLYSIPVVVRLTGPLNQAALVRAVETIVQRHEVLRTTFAYDPEIAAEPYQHIVPGWPQTLSLTVLSPDADEATIAQQVQRIVQQPFDFTQGPLFRAALFQQSPTEHLLAWVIHHSIFDGWSQSVLLRELTGLYQAFARGETALLHPEDTRLPIQYADYAVWQRRWLDGEVLEQQLDYWQRQLAGMTPLELPLDYPRLAVASDHGGLASFQISTDLATGLRQLSQKLGSTLFMTLLAAWQALLMRYSGQHDIAVGTPIAGRTRPELESLIGCFVNTLVLRADLSGAPNFAELVARVRTVCLNAYAHQDLPFEVLVERLQPERDLSRTPLFQVMFVLQNMPRATIELPDLIVEPLPGAHHTAKFDLLLAVSETEDALSGAIEYRTDLFDVATIAHMADHYLLLLTAMVADPEQPIDRVALLTEAERRLLTNQPALPPVARCIHELIATEAAHNPEAIAVQYQHETLTYQQLDQRANQLAHHLRSLGVGAERRVGVCLERSPDLVVALLGILKAGGAYVPLDPAYPQERLAFMIEDAAIAVLVTHQALQPPLSAYAGPVVYLDRDAWSITQEPITPPNITSDPDQLMYIIYTSGSTGQPKGVLITHRMLSSYLWGIRAHYTIAPSDRLLQFASISFDASVEELFVPLTTGATIVLRTTEMLDSPQVFMEVCRAWRITVLSLPTAFWHVLAEALTSATITLPPSVRMVIIGGEQAASDLAQRWQALVGERVILANAYGPTETTIAATAYIVPAALPVDAGPIAIGRPLAHACAYVLDAHMQLVPLGLPGELYIGGRQLARGYLNQPGLTAERFVPDPLSGIPGARLYKTGDRVRRRADGTLIFLGRVDQQIKLRGYRIELGEIEALLRQHEAVQDAIVTVREDKPGVPQLVAYVVGENLEPRTQNLELEVEQRTKNKEQGHKEVPKLPSPTTVGEGLGVRASNEGLAAALRSDLSQRLPAYMVPSAFVLLDCWPLTPSDKIDYRALPAPAEPQMASTASAVVPRDRWELWLAQLWADLLQRPGVDLDDNFFALGGHSLLAMRLMATIQQQLGRSLPIAALLQAPTIRQLAAYLRQESAPEPWSPLVPLQPHGDRRPLFLIHPIGGTVFCYSDLVRRLDAEQPVYGLQARGVDGDDRPHSSIAAMAAEYVRAIRALQASGPYLLGGWSMGGVVAFEIAQQLRQQSEQVALLGLIDSGLPTNEERQPEPARLVATFVQDLAGLQGRRLMLEPGELDAVTADERPGYILSRARQQQLLPADISPAQIDRLIEVFRAHLVALHTYVPAAREERAAMLEARPDTGSQPIHTDSWRFWIDQLEVSHVAGDHYSLLRAPQVTAVAAWLQQQLALAQEQDADVNEAAQHS